MRSPSLVPEELVPLIRRDARISKAPELIVNTHEELPGASRFLGFPSTGFDHKCWIGAGSQFLSQGHLGRILEEVNRDAFFTDRQHETLNEQDAEVYRIIQEFLKGFERAPVLVWLRGMIWMRSIGTAHAFRGDVRAIKVALSDETPFGRRVEMCFNDPLFSPRRLAVESSRITWQDSLHLPPRRQWAFVSIRSHNRITVPGREPRHCYLEQFGLAKRCRDDDAGLNRLLHPVELERSHSVVVNRSDGTIRYGMECAAEARGATRNRRESPCLITTAGLFDYVELMVWRLRQQRTVSGGVCLKIDEIRFALDRRSGHMLHISSGSDSFRRGFADPERSAWGMWLARRL